MNNCPFCIQIAKLRKLDEQASEQRNYSVGIVDDSRIHYGIFNLRYCPECGKEIEFNGSDFREEN